MKITAFILSIGLLCGGCMTWIAKEETYQGTHIRMVGEATSKSTSNKIKVVRNIDGKLYQVKE